MFPSWLCWIALAQAPTLPEGHFHSVRLNGELVREFEGDVLDSLPSPDGAWIAYRARVDAATGVELFAAPADGSGSPVQLSNHAADVGAVLFCPDGTRLVYAANGLYSVPVDGSQAPVLLSTRSVRSFAVTPDASRVVFDTLLDIYSTRLDGSGLEAHLAHLLDYEIQPLEYAISLDSGTVVFRGKATRQAEDVFAVPVDGGAPLLQLDPPLPAGSDVAGFELAPASSTVVYRAQQDSPTLYELYAVPLTGGVTTKLSTSSASVTALRIAPDGTRVVYLADRLFCVPLAGGTPLELSNQGAQAGFVITPDSTRVVYQKALPQLRSAALDGSSDLLLSNSALQFRLSADGARAVFTSGQPTHIDSVPTLGGPLVPLDPATNRSVELFEIDPVSGRVAFTKFGADPVDRELWGAPVDGSAAAVRLSPGAGSVQSFRTRGGRAFFTGDFQADSIERLDELYRIPLDGAQAPERVNDDFPPESVARGQVSAHVVSPQGDRVLYSADQEHDGEVATYSVPIDGGRAVKLADTGPNLGIGPVAVTPDGRFAILYGSDGAGGHEVFRAPVDGGEPPLALTSTGRTPDDVQSLVLLTPAGESILYLASHRVWTVRTDGGAAPIQLASPEIVGDGVENALENVKLSADGAWVVFAADQQHDNHENKYELFSAPTDGSQGARRLHPALPGAGQVIHFAITPDSTRVIFSARLGDTGPFELFSAPIDGSGGSLAPTRVSLPMSGAREVLTGGFASREEFQITPDGSAVVYLAGHFPDDSYELYVVPSAGGGGLRLNPRLVAGGDVLFAEPSVDPEGRLHASGVFAIAPDGRRVVYAADQRVDELHELFSATLPDFGAGPLPEPPRAKVLTPGRDRAVFEITPDGASVVYLVDTDPSTAYAGTLFRVPIDGSVSVRLHPPLTPGQGVYRFVLAPDGSSVLYDLFDAHEQLFLAPLDLSSPPRVVSGPMAGTVRALAFAPGGQRVVYKAFQNLATTLELFSASAALARHAAPPAPLQ
jgi:Tol biopolymer transport system component